jgi:cytochrome c553
MNCRKPLVLLAVALLAGGCSSIERSRSLANPQTPAKAIAEQVCSICHGLDGNSVNPNFPRLAGQQPAYFVAQVKQFRSHNRSDPAGSEYMWGLSRSLTDEQIAALAEYFAAQKPAALPADAAADALVAEGQQVFEKGVEAAKIPPCATCHGDKAQGNEAFPRLADQHSDYLMKQLMVFQRTDERPEGSIMKTIAHDLSPRNIEAVAAYLEQIPLK